MVTLTARWLRDSTTPAWDRERADAAAAAVLQEDLPIACKAAALLCRHHPPSRQRLASLGACGALSRALALSGRAHGSGNKSGGGSAAGAEQRAPLAGDRAPRTPPGETLCWAARALEELTAGPQGEDRCSMLVEAGAARALSAAMSRHPDKRELQKSGCLVLGRMAHATRLDSEGLRALGSNGGARAVILALGACSDDGGVVRAGLTAVADLSASADNRRTLGDAGACPLVPKAILAFSRDPGVAERGCRAVARLTALSGFNRTTSGRGEAAEAVATALENFPSYPAVQKWGLTAAASLVADADPSGNTSRITRAGILQSAAKALARFPHDPWVQAEGLRLFAKIATAGGSKERLGADWETRAAQPITDALVLHREDARVQHWGTAAMRALTSAGKISAAWGKAGAPEAVAHTIRAFGETGYGKRFPRGEGGGEGGGEGLRPGNPVPCTPLETLCVQFQACACALNLAGSPDGRRRLVSAGVGDAIARVMERNARNLIVQRGALTTLAALSSSGERNRERLRRPCDGGGVPRAIVRALGGFPHDGRIRCQAVLVIQNLSFSVDGARAMAEAGVVPILVRLLPLVAQEAGAAGATGAATAGRDSRVAADSRGDAKDQRLDREGGEPINCSE